jgi:hypothetical protein
MENIQHPTSDIQRPMARPSPAGQNWMVVVGCCLLFAPFLLQAQTPPALPPGALSQLQVAQPPVDVSAPVSAVATFDPPVVRVGEKTFYRVTVDATESSIQWPNKIAAPAELKFGRNARGQVTEFLGNQFRPHTSFLYEVRATATGRFVVSNFTVNVYDKPVEIPAASLEVVVANASRVAAARQLMLETSATNVFFGQPFRVRVELPAANGNQIEALREVQLNGTGFMTGKTSVRQSIEPVSVRGQLVPAFIYEMTVTPIATGPLTLFAQAFTAGREFSGPITIRGGVMIPGGPPKYVFLASDAVTVNVRPLPSAGELPGFTGAIGKFFLDPPQLSKRRLAVGEPVHLKVVFHGEGDLTRLVPPAPPRSPDWQVIADNPPDTGYTLIPLTDETRATPAIPFCYFDPTTAKYVDLTIPPQPVTVTGASLPTELSAPDEAPEPGAPTRLSSLAPVPGPTASGLEPLQLRGWFVGVQFAPVLGFLALWQWDRRRRFFEAHPEIVRRRQARRALRREKRKLQKAIADRDAAAFVRHAAAAMKIAAAPQIPAEAPALVGADVLAQLEDAARHGPDGDAVRKIFAAADTQFAATPGTPADWSALQSGVDAVLAKLEEKL